MAFPQQSLRPSNVLPLRAAGRRTPLRGTVLLGRYRVDAERARTRVGVTHEAFDLASKNRVSVEIGTSLEPGAAQGRFVREAMVAQRLEGERILRVLDTGRLPDGTPFVVREAAVTTLAREVDARGSIPIAEAVGFVLDAAEAVAEGHALGLSHGRVDLDTILLARDAPDGDLRGKLAWTSAADGGSRDDERAFARDIKDLARALATMTSSEDDGASTLPAGLGSVVARALAPGPSKYTNVGELAAALAPYAPRGHDSARNIASLLGRAGRRDQPKAAVVRVMTRPQPAKVTRRTERRGARTVRTAVAVVALVTLVLAIAMFVARMGTRGPALGATEVKLGTPTATLADDVTAEGLRARSTLPLYEKETAPRPALEPTKPPQTPAGPAPQEPEDGEPVEEEPAEPLGIPI